MGRVCVLMMISWGGVVSNETGCQALGDAESLMPPQALDTFPPTHCCPPTLLPSHTAALPHCCPLTVVAPSAILGPSEGEHSKSREAMWEALRRESYKSPPRYWSTPFSGIGPHISVVLVHTSQWYWSTPLSGIGPHISVVFHYAISLCHTAPSTHRKNLIFFGGSIRPEDPSYSGGARQAYHEFVNARNDPRVKYGGDELAFRYYGVPMSGG